MRTLTHALVLAAVAALVLGWAVGAGAAGPTPITFTAQGRSPVALSTSQKIDYGYLTPPASAVVQLANGAAPDCLFSGVRNDGAPVQQSFGGSEGWDPVQGAFIQPPAIAFSLTAPTQLTLTVNCGTAGAYSVVVTTELPPPPPPPPPPSPSPSPIPSPSPPVVSIHTVPPPPAPSRPVPPAVVMPSPARTVPAVVITPSSSMTPPTPTVPIVEASPSPIPSDPPPSPSPRTLAVQAASARRTAGVGWLVLVLIAVVPTSLLFLVRSRRQRPAAGKESE